MTAIIVSHLLIPSGKYVQHGLPSASALILRAHVLKPLLGGDSCG